MGELTERESLDNVNVTLNLLGPMLAALREREFPCPLCGARLPILISKKNKPYFTCNLCAVQIFVRGKAGIARLREIVNSDALVTGKKEVFLHGVNLFNRLEELKLQKRDLESKRGIIFRNEDAENVIRVIDAEIEKVQRELAKEASDAERGE